MSKEERTANGIRYRCEAVTRAGFVQQLACCYFRHGYHYYVIGEVPKRKDPRRIDEQLVARYDLGISRFARARRKRAGLANAQYLRYRVDRGDAGGQFRGLEGARPRKVDRGVSLGQGDQ